MQIQSIESLVETLEKANKAYREGNPIMTDSDYDALETQLSKLDPNHPFLHRLQDDADFNQDEPLTIPMGSQQKALVLEEMDSFYRTTGEDAYVASFKMDGMSAELTYELMPSETSYKLVKAVTRGDGKIGSNVTQVALRIPSIPKTIPVTDTPHSKAVVRGEIFMKQEALIELNNRLKADGREEVANTRNGTVGLVKTLKNLPYANVLSFKAFNLLYVD